MQSGDLQTFRDWFSRYTRSFYTDIAEDYRNIDLKVRHTYFVCENIVGIAREEHLAHDELMVVETAALFHDLGRFLQYSLYKTFRDSISVNHGRLGAEVLEKENILRHLPLHEQQWIINTVRFHNAFEVPPFEDPETVLFLQLIRDADKLDIWRIFSEYYEFPEDKKASAAGLGLPDLPDYSEAILSCLYKKKPAPLSGLKTLNDFKLMQLSWIYDINFRHSFRVMEEKAYIRRIAAALPKTEEIEGAISVIRKFVHEKAGTKSNKDIEL